jgi:hypothetical protein
MNDGVHDPGLTLVKALGQTASRLERDYAFLDIYIRVQHGRYDEALDLVEAMLILEGEHPDLMLARAVVLSLMSAHERALDTIRVMDRLFPVEIVTGSTQQERVRVRSYIKARAIFALTGALDEDGRAALDFYLRRGTGQTARNVTPRSPGNR